MSSGLKGAGRSLPIRWRLGLISAGVLAGELVLLVGDVGTALRARVASARLLADALEGKKYVPRL